MNEKMTIVIMFRTGTELRIKCDGFNIKKNILEQLTEANFEGIVENKPIWFDLHEVLCIYRVISDEQG